MLILLNFNIHNISQLSKKYFIIKLLIIIFIILIIIQYLHFVNIASFIICILQRFSLFVDFIHSLTYNEAKKVGDKMNLNERIKKLRLENKYTVKELGNIFHLSESTISLYESGKRTPNKDFIIKMSNFFNVSTDYLLGNSDIPKAEHYIHFDQEMDLAIELKKMLAQIENNEITKFNSLIIDDEIKQLLIKAIKIIIETGDILINVASTESCT